MYAMTILLPYGGWIGVGEEVEKIAGNIER